MKTNYSIKKDGRTKEKQSFRFPNDDPKVPQEVFRCDTKKIKKNKKYKKKQWCFEAQLKSNVK